MVSGAFLLQPLQAYPVVGVCPLKLRAYSVLNLVKLFILLVESLIDFVEATTSSCEDRRLR